MSFWEVPPFSNINNLPYNTIKKTRFALCRNQNLSTEGIGHTEMRLWRHTLKARLRSAMISHARDLCEQGLRNGVTWSLETNSNWHFYVSTRISTSLKRKSKQPRTLKTINYLPKSPLIFIWVYLMRVYRDFRAASRCCGFIILLEMSKNTFGHIYTHC